MDLDLLNTGVQSEEERDLAGIFEESRRKANESSTENTEDEFDDQAMQSTDWEYEDEQFFNDTTLPDISDDEERMTRRITVGVYHHLRCLLYQHPHHQPTVLYKEQLNHRDVIVVLRHPNQSREVDLLAVQGTGRCIRQRRQND